MLERVPSPWGRVSFNDTLTSVARAAVELSPRRIGTPKTPTETRADAIQRLDMRHFGERHQQLAQELCTAAKSGELPKLRHLLQNGAVISATDRSGCTALLRASRRGKQRCVAELISRGAAG